MDGNESECKQSARNQYVAVGLVVFGTIAIFVGCHFHYAELTTSAAGITGAGINMLTTQIRNTLNNKQGTINVAPDPEPPSPLPA